MKIFQKDVIVILLFGIFLRFLISPFTLNWDLLAYTHVTAKLSSGGLQAVYSDPLSAYPPITYWFINTYTNLLKPLLTGQFDTWLRLNDLSAVAFPGIFRFLFLLKLPIIILEIAAAIIFARIFPEGKRNKILFFWMINPVILYIVPAFSNVDIFPLFFIMLSFYFYFRKNMQITPAFLLGIAASFKLFPLFFLPFLVFSVPGLRKKIMVFAAFLLPFIFLQFPALSIPQYRNNVLAGGNSSKILFAYLPIGQERGLIYFVLFYVLIFFSYLGKKNLKKYYLQYCFYVMAGIFSLTLFHVQWFIWLIPFIFIYQFSQNPNKIPMVALYLSFAGLVLFQQASLNIGMLAPLDPTLWKLDWPLRKALGDNILTLINICHTVIAGSLIWMAYRFGENSPGDENNYEKA